MPLPGLGRAQERENPRNLRFLGRVQGQRPCRVWAAPSVTPRHPARPNQKTCVEKHMIPEKSLLRASEGAPLTCGVPRRRRGENRRIFARAGGEQPPKHFRIAQQPGQRNLAFPDRAVGFDWNESRCGCLKMKKSLMALFHFQGRTRVSARPRMHARGSAQDSDFIPRMEFGFGRGRGAAPAPRQGT